jgi:GAF domain-containing protein
LNHNIVSNIEQLRELGRKIDEKERLREVDRFKSGGIGLDHVTSIVADLFRTSISSVTIIEENDAVVRSARGWEGPQRVPRQDSLCARVMYDHNTTIILSDKDERCSDLVWFQGETPLKFYIGVPLITEKGYPLGALCATGYEPRDPTERQIKFLEELAQITLVLLKLR